MNYLLNNFCPTNMNKNDKETDITFTKKLFYSHLKMKFMKKIYPNSLKEGIGYQLIKDSCAVISIDKIKNFLFFFCLSCRITYNATYLYDLFTDVFYNHNIAFESIWAKDNELYIVLPDEYFEEEKYRKDCIKAYDLANLLANDLKINVIITHCV